MAQADGGGSAEILVTAQRRSERNQDVPISIANIGSEQLTSANALSLSDVVKLSAGVRFDLRSALILPTVRGLTTSVICAGCGSNVGLYQDGFLSPSLQAADFQLNNVESVQVLKGPQGTLFGRNVVAGAILVNTKKPSTETSVTIEAGYGSFDSKRLQFYGTTGLTDRIALDLSAVYSASDGFVTNIFTNDKNYGASKNYGIRAGLNVDVTDSLSLLLRYSHNKVDDPRNILFQPGIVNGQLICTDCSRAGAIFSTKIDEVSGGAEATRRAKLDGYQITAKWDMAFAALTSYTQWRTDNVYDSRSSGGYTNLLGSGSTNVPWRENTFTQELLLTSNPGGRLQYTLGLYYFNNRAQADVNLVRSTVVLPRLPADYFFFSASGATSKSWAAYADVTYEIADHLFLTGGLRYTKDKIENPFTINSALVRTVFAPDLNTSRVTPRAVVRYELNDQSSLYASFSVGYKGAIYNTQGADPTQIQPEKLVAYEIGFKHGSRELSASLAGYYYDYSNEQVSSAILLVGSNSPSIVIRNAASSKIYGIDAEVRYKVSPNFDVFSAINWSHARYSRFLADQAFTTLVNPTTGVITYPPLIIDGSGFRMNRAPDFSATVGANYNTQLAGGKLDLAANFSYQSMIFFDTAQQLPEGAHGELDLRAAWTDPSDHYTFAISAKNVTEKRYRVQGSLFSRGVAVVWNPPRVIEASVRVKF